MILIRNKYKKSEKIYFKNIDILLSNAKIMSNIERILYKGILF